MREMLRYGLILGLICSLASGLLAGVNHLTKAKIIAQAQAEEASSIKELFPGAANFQSIKSKAGEDIYYKAYNQEGNFLGVAFKAIGKGYSSDIETLVGMTKEGKIIAIKIINQNETPGLGSRVNEPSFTGQFTGRDTQDLSGVQAITGATISSRAVIDAVKNKAEEIKNEIASFRSQ